MTSYVPVELSVRVQADDAHSLHLAIRGDLDYDSIDAFTHTVNSALDAHAEQHGPALRHVHLDWEGLTAIDSGGLSALIGVGRRTHSAGVTVHLHRQPVHLTRLLEITGVDGYLTGHTDAGGRAAADAGGDAESAPVP
ncbi:STAS domain-containing protein [Embleya sp. NPDC008237]|uniref:STAS domain-containing protein n=1 Tax=Embleya sp. NPDC008237 TaxID=3363978 RepID=UPI0036F156F3